jgi:cytochrome c-type biogenesis protein CcmH/NrfG
VNPRLVSWVLAAAVAVYLVFVAMRSWALVQSGEPVAIVLGLSVLVIPVIGAWLLWRELMFGRQMQELGRRLGEEGGLPVDDLPRTPGARIERDAADERFAHYERQVQQSPEDWRCWYRLAIGYDDARDRKRARGAMRTAIRLFDESA